MWPPIPVDSMDSHRTQSAWWFGTWILFSIIYIYIFILGMSSETYWRTPSFFKMVTPWWTNITMENHHVERENSLFLWPCSSSQTVRLPGRVKPPSSLWPWAAFSGFSTVRWWEPQGVRWASKTRAPWKVMETSRRFENEPLVNYQWDTQLVWDIYIITT